MQRSGKSSDLKAGIPPLVINDALKEYPAKPTVRRALNLVSLRVKENELLGLLGPNGAGKTTIMKMFVGDETPTSGEVFFPVFSFPNILRHWFLCM